MKPKLLSTLILLSVFSSAMGQESGYLPGYIITNSNDTIGGQVKYINTIPFRILPDIKFKGVYDYNSKVKLYPPTAIRGYKAGEKIFHSLELPDGGEKMFMELVIDGYLKLYMTSASAFGVPQYGPSVTTHYYFLRKGETKLFDADKGRFKQRVSEYLADDDWISTDIKNGNYKRKDIEQLVKDYNMAKK